MNPNKKRLLWFAGIYASSLLAYALVTYLLRTALRFL
jgi:hypothetical protein